MDYGVQVNFWKGYLVSVNVSGKFLAMVSDFRHFRIGLTPLKYLGVPIEAKHWKVTT